MSIALLAASDYFYHLLPFLEPALRQFVGVLGPILGETARLLGSDTHFIYPLPL